MQGKWRAIGLLLVMVLAFALLPAIAMGAPAITQGVQGVVKDAVTGVPIPFANLRIEVNGGGFVYFTAEWDGSYSYATVASDDIGVVARSVGHDEKDVYPVLVNTGAVTTLDFLLNRAPDFSQPVYRFFNMKGGVHFYTASDSEFLSVYKNQASVFKYDGVSYWVSEGPSIPPQIGESGYINHSTTPLYRFFNRKTGVHFYTKDVAEMNNVKNNLSDLYTYEGIAYNVSGPEEWGAAVYRFYNPSHNAHFYTTDSSEIFDKLSNYYHFEGTGFYTGGWEWVPPLPDGGEPGV